MKKTPYLRPKPENDTLMKGKTETEKSVDGSVIFYFVTLDVYAYFSFNIPFVFRLAGHFGTAILADTIW